MDLCRTSVWEPGLPDAGGNLPMFFVQLTSHHGVALMRSPFSSGMLQLMFLDFSCFSRTTYSIHEGVGMTNQIDLAALAIVNGQV